VSDPATLCDEEGSQAAKAEAIKRVDDHADPAMKKQILGAIRLVATVREELTTDHVWEALAAAGYDTRGIEPRLMGALMLKAGRAGWIRPTDRFEPSKRKAAHRGPKRIWKSAIF
jgi:hypothetical protein